MKQSSFTYQNVHLAPGEQIGLHRQDTWELSWVITGTGARLVGDKTEPFRSGDVVLIPPGMPHCWYFDGEVTDAHGRIANVTLTFGDAFLDRLAAFAELEAAVNILKERKEAVAFYGGKARAITALLEEMRSLDAARQMPPLLKIMLLLAAGEDGRVICGYREPSRSQERVSQVQTYIVCNMRRGITLDSVANYVGMNRTAFCIFFKKATGKTFVSYLNEFRIGQACRLLEQDRESIAEVCYSVGFNNVPYFNRVFKRVKGMSPSEWKQSDSFL